ncbi:hypothetical protein N7528_009785 [Penicillium herquei]|nr:hypothetical protein N7528_009785 [Penicillium herquei]
MLFYRPLVRLSTLQPFRAQSSLSKFARAKAFPVEESEHKGPTPLNDLFSVRGKTAICTGITGGLGKSLGVALAEAGANIVSIQLPGDFEVGTLEKEVRSFGAEFHRFDCDIGDSISVRKCFTDIWMSGIVPDILVNCAGVNRHGPLEALTDEDISLVLNVNLKGSFVAAQEMAKQLLRLRRPGKIINIGSMTAYQAAWNTSAYAAAKAGVVQFTKAFSNELAGRNIQVNCICPGYFTTPMTTNLAKHEEYNDFVIQRTPAGRWGEPNDLRGALIFLCSPASDFVTGASVVVDGGMLGM